MENLLLLVNFGGPRTLEEIEPFLKSLLTDQEVVRTSLPPFLHRLLFNKIAKKRARKVAHDYALIGGKSPIYQDTETLAEKLRSHLSYPVLTFHRYLPETHPGFLKQLPLLAQKRVLVFPLFPQFSYATTGSIAHWFSKHFPTPIIHKMRWIKSYPAHPAFIACLTQTIRAFLQTHALKEEETILLFSPHGLPQKFICTGDIYESECQLSFQEVSSRFPKALSKLAYQSKFGRGEWLKPYTEEFCRSILSWSKGYRQVVFIPLSFPSDHIETLFEVEYQYLPLIREKGLKAYRCPALNLREDWIQAIPKILQSSDLLGTQMLLRHPYRCCRKKPLCDKVL